MYNLYIIRSPLQFINAIEAKHYFQTKNNILYIIHSKSKVNSKHMHKILAMSEWDKVIEINRDNKKNNLLTNVKHIKALKKKTFNYIFSGDIGNINTAFISSLKKRETFLLDDGTMTLISHEKVSNPNKKEKWNINRFIKQNRYKLFRLNCSLQKEDINYFTIFDIHPYRNEKIIKNDFSFFRNNFLTKLTKDLNTVYFIGQNLVIENIMDEDVYIKYIKNIIQYYKDKTIIYYPHRFEKVSKNFYLLENENFIIKETTQPIEIELLTKEKYPMYIASFVSSALSSLHGIFEDTNINSFVIKQNHLNHHKESFQLIYDKQNKAIQQIDLNIPTG